MIARSTLVFPWLAPQIHSTQRMPETCEDSIYWKLITQPSTLPRRISSAPRQYVGVLDEGKCTCQTHGASGRGE
jgi:hypothetical protein